MKRARDHAASHHLQVLSLSMSPEPRKALPGNNRYGARGTLKCLNCRNRKARCEFNSKEEDCKWCAARGLKCGEKLLGEKHQIREHRKLLGIGNTPLSVIAAKLELAYPRHTPWEISEMAREILLETGDGPDALELPSRGASLCTDDSVTRVRAQSVKLEASPKTPTVSIQAQTFLSAAASQEKSPPRSVPPRPRPTTQSSNTLDPFPSYDFSVAYIPPLRQQQYEERDVTSVYDPSYFTQKFLDNSGTWSLHGIHWQETV